MDEYLGAILQNLEDKIDKLAKHAVNKEYKCVNYLEQSKHQRRRQYHSVKRERRSIVAESFKPVSHSLPRNQKKKGKLTKKTAKDSTRSKLTIFK